MTVIKDQGTRATPPPFGEEHEELRETISRFIEREIAPNVEEWEEAREFPRSLYERCGELGFLGLKYPAELGGQGGDYVHDAVWTEALAYSGAGGGVAAGLGAHTGIATPPIFKFGTPAQHQRFLVPAIRGEKICALGITEPGAGSDVAGIRTFARKVDGGYVVNGSKTFITNGVRADFLVCAVKTTEEGGHHGISFLVLEREMPGYEVVSKLEKMGWHASDTGELVIHRRRGPGREPARRGGRRLLPDHGQLPVGAAADGARRRRRDEAAARGRGRLFEGARGVRAPDRPLSGDPPQDRRDLDQGRGGEAMTYNALRLFHEGHDAIKEVTQAKLYSQRAAVEVADEVIQIHGGYGYMREYGVERAYRDARLGPIGGGTDEVMKEILSKQLGL